MTGPFEIVEDETVEDKVEKKEEEIIEGVNVGVLREIRNIERAVIKSVGRNIIGATKGLNE